MSYKSHPCINSPVCILYVTACVNCALFWPMIGPIDLIEFRMTCNIVFLSITTAWVHAVMRLVSGMSSALSVSIIVFSFLNLFLRSPINLSTMILVELWGVWYRLCWAVKCRKMGSKATSSRDMLHLPKYGSSIWELENNCLDSLQLHSRSENYEIREHRALNQDNHRKHWFWINPGHKWLVAG